MAEPIVLLHGFGGTRRAWEAVVAELPRERYLPVAVDLPGHGAAAGVQPIDFASCVARVLRQAPERFALAGYSMGGRIALQVALSRPERVSSLSLISTTAGIEDAAERAQRHESDARLADALQSAPLEEFIARWNAQPLFAADPPAVSRAAGADLRRNDARDLARALRGVGTGQMEPLWSRLGELAIAVTVLVGERDVKFRELGERLAAAIPHARLVVVPGAGHRLHLEAPSAVARALRR